MRKSLLRFKKLHSNKTKECNKVNNFYKTIYVFNTYQVNLTVYANSISEAQVETTVKLRERRPHDWFMFRRILTTEISEEEAFS